MTSYRESHKNKGIDYHQLFDINPRRRLIWSLEKKFISEVISQLPQSSKLTHLDFACGTGRWLNFIKQYTGCSVGVDISSSMLEVARKNNQDLEIFEGDITQMDILGNRKFDIITAFRFFPNAEPELREEVAKSLRKHLNPNGLLIFNNHTNYNAIRSRLVRFATLNKKGHFGALNTDIESLIARVGMKIVDKIGIGYVPEWETRLLPLRKVVELVETTMMPIKAIHGFAENIIYIAKPDQ